MKKENKNLKKLVMFTSVLSLLLVAWATTLTIPAEPVPSGDIFPDVWEITTEKWVNGNPSGYAEGDTAAMAVRIKAVAGTGWTLTISLQIHESPFTDAYGFTDFDQWDLTVTPPTLPNGPAVDDNYPVPWDTGHSFIWAYNADIISVTTPIVIDNFS